MGKRMENTRIVVKVGTSTLTYENGRLNIRRVDKLCKVLSDLQNSGKEIVLVSSGAIGVGVGQHRRKAGRGSCGPMRVDVYVR